MDSFIGRSAELRALEGYYQKKGFQMGVVYGRRRIGKSTMLRKFIQDKKAVYFTATKAGMERNLQLFCGQILSELAPDMSGMSFSSVENLFQFLGDRCKEERIIVVIDEIPYLAEVDKSILSVLQYYIDNQWSDSQMFLVLCGSSVSFMEDEVLSEKSPIFGRRSFQIKLDAFDYKEAARFVPSYTCEEKAICYGITGGVAKYLSLLDDGVSLDENIMRLFFEKTGYLYEETDNLLLQEFRNVAMYGDIISMLASGVNHVNKIADKLYLERSAVSYALSKLSAVGIVVKEMAITDENNKKKVQYTLKDGMFRFWYRFVSGAISAIELDRGRAYYEKMVKPCIPEYMGQVFEEMCRHYTLELGVDGRLDGFFANVGRWWGTNPRTKEQTDIDVVGLDMAAKKAVLGECKYRNAPIDMSVYHELTMRNGLIDNRFTTVQYLLFSKGGFTDSVMKETDSHLVLKMTLEDLYEE